MTGFKAAYVAVFEAVQEVLQKQKTLQQGQVVLDKDAKEIDSLDKLPLIILTMDETKAVPTDGTAKYELKVPIVVVAVIVEYEKENWFDKMNVVMGEVVDALLDTPTLNGAVRDLALASYFPGKITLQDKVYRGGVIQFNATLDYTNV